MIYDVSISLRVSGDTNNRTTIEASSRAEAEAIAKTLEQKELIKTHVITASSYVNESSANWSYERGAVYLIKRYSRWVPAKCTHSYGYNQSSYGNHHFQYLNTRVTVRFRGMKGAITRVGKRMCGDGQISDKCETDACAARFMCLTTKGAR